MNVTSITPRTIIALAFAAVLFAPGARANAENVSVCNSVPQMVQQFSAVYGDDPDFESLDLYAPDGVRAAPLIAFVHGGAWAYGDKAQYAGLGEAFAGCGIAFAIVNYRLAPAVRADQQAVDVAHALRWLHDRSGSSMFAGSRIYLMGHSAGAQIAAFVMARGSHVLADAGFPPGGLAGVIALDGVGYTPGVSTHGIALHPLWLLAMRQAFGTDSSTWKTFDIDQYLTGEEPPLLVVHASRDTIAPQAESMHFADALRKAGDRVTYYERPDEDHFSVLREMTDGPDDPMFQTVAAFVTGIQ